MFATAGPRMASGRFRPRGLLSIRLFCGWAGAACNRGVRPIFPSEPEYMPSLDDIEELIERLREWVKSLKNASSQTKVQLNKAIPAMATALRETKAYIAQQQQGGASTGRHQEIARLWRTAAVEIRPVNEELADRFELKAQAWTNPEDWPAERVEKTRIAITQVEREIKSIRQAR